MKNELLLSELPFITVNKVANKTLIGKNNVFEILVFSKQSQVPSLM